MKHYKIVLMLVLTMILISSSIALGAPIQVKNNEAEVQVETGIYTPGEGEPLSAAAIGAVDSVMQGTGWVRQRAAKFKGWRPWGWGTTSKIKSAPSYEWVHLPVPLITRADGALMKISKAEFCARSTNGAQVKPVRLHLRSNYNLFGNVGIIWPNDTAIHCAWINFNPPVWKESLGISVQVYYGNTTDSLTLLKGWARTQP